MTLSLSPLLANRQSSPSTACTTLPYVPLCKTHAFNPFHGLNLAGPSQQQTSERKLATTGENPNGYMFLTFHASQFYTVRGVTHKAGVICAHWCSCSTSSARAGGHCGDHRLACREDHSAVNSTHGLTKAASRRRRPSRCIRCHQMRQQRDRNGAVEDVEEARKKKNNTCTFRARVHASFTQTRAM